MAWPVPTHSRTESTPIPSVISLIRATPSSPRSVTMSVAPNSRASFWRDSCRLMAMIRSAPFSFAAITPHSPTAPSPTTTAVEPGLTSAASAAYQPVPITSETASRPGQNSSPGTSSVATRVPWALGMRTYSAWQVVMNSRFTQLDCHPLRQLAQVLSEVANEPTANWPGSTEVTSLPTASTKPTYSCPMGCASSVASRPRQGHRSVPHTQVTAVRMTASVGSRISGSSRVSKRTSPGAWITAPCMGKSLCFVGGVGLGAVRGPPRPCAPRIGDASRRRRPSRAARPGTPPRGRCHAGFDSPGHPERRPGSPTGLHTQVRAGLGCFRNRP
ncbi:hypothetical protein SCANM63S_09385 [Streptomyces canarius]